MYKVGQRQSEKFIAAERSQEAACETDTYGNTLHNSNNADIDGKSDIAANLYTSWRKDNYMMWANEMYLVCSILNNIALTLKLDAVVIKPAYPILVAEVCTSLNASRSTGLMRNL